MRASMVHSLRLLLVQERVIVHGNVDRASEAVLNYLVGVAAIRLTYVEIDRES